MPDQLSSFLGNIVKSQPNIQPPAASAPSPLKNFLSGVLAKANTNAAALTSKSPFLKNVGDEVASGIHSTASALDAFANKSAANIKDAVTGKLPVSASDVGEGLYKTTIGIGKIAQGINQGVIQLGKSALSNNPGLNDTMTKLAANPGFKAFLGSVAGTDTIPTVQDIYNKGVEHAAGTLGATPTQAKVYGGALAIGTIFADNPFFGPEKGGLKLTDEIVSAISKTDDVAQITQHFISGGVDKDVAEKIAPVFVHTDTPKTVRTAANEINNGVANAKTIQQDQPVTNPETGAIENSPGFKERGFVTSTKEQIPELRTRVAGQYIPRSTDDLAIKARNDIADDIDKAEQVAREGTDDRAVATAAELVKHYTDEGRKATDTATQNALFDKAAEVANDMARKLTESGRAVQAASILGRLTPEGQARFAAREIQKYNELNPGRKIPELTGEQIQTITGKAKIVSDMPDGIEKAKAFKALQDDIADLVPTPLYKKIINVWKAGLLTGIKTSGLNIGSNLFHGVSELAKDVPAVAVDSVASLFTGKRTIGLTARGYGSGTTEGFKKGFDYLKTGYDERNAIQKMDVKRVNFGTSPFAKAIQTYEEAVFRTLGAEDQPFYYGAKAHSLYSQAIAMAKNEGVKGADRATFIKDAVENPTDEMLRNATVDAETAVFQNNTALAEGAAAIKRAMPLTEAIIPFSRTPAAVAGQIVNYSPVGIVKEIASQIAKKQFDQRTFAQAAGRAVVGTGILYLGTKLYDNDLITLDRPTDKTTQQEYVNEGRQPNSIKIGGKWRQVGELGPLGQGLLIGAYFADGLKNTGSLLGALSETALGGLSSLTQQTFLSGVSDFIGAITDPKTNGPSYFKGLIGSVVPTIVGDVARATDSTERRPEGIFGTLESRIPGIRETLQPQVSSLGEKTQTPDFLTTMADPSRPTTVTNNPVALELKRLTDAGQKVGPTILGDNGNNGFKGLKPVENTKLLRGTGLLIQSKLGNLFKDPAYQQASDEEKVKAIGNIVDKSKNVARAEMALYLTHGLQGQELTSKLKQLKASGLLSKEVFNLYGELR